MRTTQRGSVLVSALLGMAVILSGGCSKIMAGGGPVDVTLDPPPPGKGVQMVIGPLDVKPGEEWQKNFYLKLPSDQPLDVFRVEIKMNVGSHHFNLFKSDKEDIPDGTVEDSFDNLHWESWDLFVDSQVPDFTWELPKGVAVHFEPHQQLDLQLHYANTEIQKTLTGHAKAIVNLWAAEPGSVKEYTGGIFAQDRKLALPPHAESSWTAQCDFPQDLKLLVMTGHFHSRGKEMHIYRKRADGSRGEEIYSSTNWNEPPEKIFTDPIPFKQGEGIIWTSTYVNNTDNIIGFGPHNQYQEHSNVFAFYYPSLPNRRAIYCFN